MVIYSWNMLFSNERLDGAFAFIRDADFDIFCLQEVPEKFLERLKTLPYHLASRHERKIQLKGNASSSFAVILSKHPIEKHWSIFLPGHPSHSLPLHTRLFVYFTPLMLFSDVREAVGYGFADLERGALYADVAIGGASVRVFNFHLTLTQPAWRIDEFASTLAKRDQEKPTIVCGDFNTLEKPHISILNWLLGGRVSDAFLWHRERRMMERHFVEHELVNPLRGSVTHPLSRSQLDHILVSESFSIKNASVIRDRHGSDHHPIRVEAE